MSCCVDVGGEGQSHVLLYLVWDLQAQAGLTAGWKAHAFM